MKEKTKKEIQCYEPFIKVATKALENFFNFSPPVEKIVFTVNLLESFYRGFSISLKDTTYIITGPSKEPNLRNLLHEMLHLYVGQIKFEGSKKMEDELQKIPESLKKNYLTTEKIIEESLVRSLVVYLSQRSEIVENQELFRSDLDLQLPQVYLHKLETDLPESFSRQDLKKLGELSWDS